MIRSLILFALICCSSFASQAQEVLRGTFTSKSGVMDVVSCHCGNGGYIKDGFGDRFAICLDDSGLDIENGAEVTVVGEWTSSTIEPDEFSPCPSGSFDIFEVSEVHDGVFAEVNVETHKYDGIFESTQGRMVSLSCFCAEGGYLNFDEYERINLCLSELDETYMELLESGDRVWVTGQWVEKHIELNPQSPCSGGSMQMLMVTKVERY